MAPPPKKQVVDWRTVNLNDFSNVQFKENPNLKSAASSAVKNGAGRFLEFVSPKMRCFGLGYQVIEGKAVWSISQAFGEDDSEDVLAYRKFLEELDAHMQQFCDGKQVDPLIQYPKIKDAKGEFMKKGMVYLRDTERSPTVRYKIYPERSKLDGMETGCVDVRLYDKKDKPLFHYGDKLSEEHFRGKEIPERSSQAEMDAVEKGCLVRVLCTARVSYTFNGAMYYKALTATQIKRVAAGSGSAGGHDTVADFGDNDDDDEEEQQQQQLVAIAPPTVGKKRAALDQGDGIERELEDVPVVVAPPPEKHEDDVEEEEQQAIVAPPPPPSIKKRKLTVPK